MIRLRGAIDRALGRRWLGPLIILLLVVVMVFVVLHTAVDAAHDEIGLACLAVAAVILGLLVRPKQETPLRPSAPLRRRGPPARPAEAPPNLILQALPPPLRL
jgi:hypothetical protein